MTDSENNEDSPVLTEKKLNPFLKILAGLFGTIFALIFILFCIFAFSALDKKSFIKFIPEDFSVYVHSNSLWQTVEPLMDLKAADMILSAPELTSQRGAFMQLRSSSLRNNVFVKFCANRKADLAVYHNEEKIDYVAFVDLSFLSAATRIGSLFFAKLNIPNLTYNQQFALFEYKMGQDTIYLKPVKNLLIICSNYELYQKTILEKNDFPAEKKSVLLKKSATPIRVVVDSKKLCTSILGESEIFQNISDYISENSLSSVEFSITDEAINASANLPLTDFSSEDDKNNFNNLLQSQATAPSFVSRMSSIVQYYTLLNAGSLKELKTAIFPILPKDNKIEELWTTGNRLCKALFSLNLDELLFSWTGNEFAALGIENKNDPVFVIQIKDEKQRQYVFEKVISSIIIKDNSSLILDGVRLSRIEFPSFIQDILNALNVSLSLPYFMVKDGYIYFCSSAENLSMLYTSMTSGQKLTQSQNWNSVSSKQNAATNVSLYYNLERTIPFFLRSNAGMAKILELYSLGRFDLRLKNSSLQIQIQAVSNKQTSSTKIPGFPISLEGKNNGELISNGNSLFWIETDRKLTKMDLPSTSISTKAFNDKIYITANKASKKESNFVWVLTETGEVYILDDSLNAIEGFPVYTGEKPSAKPVLSSDGKDTLYFTTEAGNLISVSKNTEINKINLLLTGKLKSALSIENVMNSDIIQLYDKSFFGRILTVKNGKLLEDNIIPVNEIAFGSPALKAKGNDYYTAFISQRGNFYLWKNGTLVNEFPKQMEGIYNSNAVASKKYFYVVSNNSELTRIDYKGNTLTVKFSQSKAENPYLKIIDDNIYVCADGNSVYGFNEKLELLYGYPVAGWGIPAFADVNGDKKSDCFTLSVDKKIYAYNIN